MQVFNFQILNEKKKDCKHDLKFVFQYIYQPQFNNKLNTSILILQVKYMRGTFKYLSSSSKWRYYIQRNALNEHSELCRVSNGLILITRGHSRLDFLPTSFAFKHILHQLKFTRSAANTIHRCNGHSGPCLRYDWSVRSVWGFNVSQRDARRSNLLRIPSWNDTHYRFLFYPTPDLVIYVLHWNGSIRWCLSQWARKGFGQTKSFFAVHF